MVSEFVCAHLMDLVGLPSPRHAVLEVENTFVADNNYTVLAGPAFATRWEKLAATYSGSAEVLKRLENPSVIAMIVVFDTWVLNGDRFGTYMGSGSDNLDNLLLVPNGNKLSVMVIDHSHAFVESTFEDGLPDMWWEDDGVFGVHPNFAPFLVEDALFSAIDAVSSVTSQQIEEVIDQIPREWSIGTLLSERLKQGIFERGQSLSTWLPQRLLSQPPLHPELGNRL